MKKYIVQSLAVSGHSNKVYRSGDEVRESDFPQGHADELVKSGHLKPVEDIDIDDNKDNNTSDSAPQDTKIPVVKNPPPRPPSKRDKK